MDDNYVFYSDDSHDRIRPKQSLNKLSPLTEYFIDVSLTAAMSNINTILIDPYLNLDSILLLSFTYITKTKKNVIIFSTSKNIEELNNTYYLLERNNVPLFYIVPIGIKNDEGVFAKPYILKTVTKKKRLEQREKIENCFLECDRARIILIPIDDQIIIGGVNDVMVNMSGPQRNGFMIVDGIDPETTNEIEGIINWAKKGIPSLFRFSDPSMKYVDEIKRSLNAVMIPMIPALLESESPLRDDSIRYFESISSKETTSYIAQFNIDNHSSYSSVVIPEILIIDSSNTNLDVAQMNLFSGISKVGSIGGVVEQLLLTLIRFSYDMTTSFLSPSRLSRPIKLDEWTSVNGMQLVEMIKRESNSLSEREKSISLSMVDSFLTMYSALDRCKEYGCDNGYSRENKEYVLLDTIGKYLEETNYTISVTTAYRYGKPIINELIKRHYPGVMESKRISIANTRESYLSKDCRDMMILSGKLDVNYLHILSKPYKKIVILAYSGHDYDVICNQIEVYKILKNCQRMLFSDSVREIDTVLKLSHPHESIKTSLFVSDPEECEIGDTECSCDIELISSGSTSLKELIKPFLNNPSVKAVFKEEKIRQDVTKTDVTTKYDMGDTIEVGLTRVHTKEKTVINLSKNSDYLFYDVLSKDFIDSIITVDKVGWIVVVFDDNERSSLLDLMFKLYNLDEDIDRELIQLWKSETEKIEFKYGSKTKLYKEYKEKGGKVTPETFKMWLNNDVIAPQKIEDLKILGEVIGSEVISKESESIFYEAESLRNLRRSLGRKINKIMFGIINGTISSDDDPNGERIKNMMSKWVYRIDAVGSKQ